jgi:hypothetical protein
MTFGLPFSAAIGRNSRKGDEQNRGCDAKGKAYDAQSGNVSHALLSSGNIVFAIKPRSEKLFRAAPCDKKKPPGRAALGMVRSESRGAGGPNPRVGRAVLLHEKIGHAAEDKDGGDSPQNDDRHGSLLWLPASTRKLGTANQGSNATHTRTLAP